MFSAGSRYDAVLSGLVKAVPLLASQGEPTSREGAAKTPLVWETLGPGELAFILTAVPVNIPIITITSIIAATTTHRLQLRHCHFHHRHPLHRGHRHLRHYHHGPRHHCYHRHLRHLHHYHRPHCGHFFGTAWLGCSPLSVSWALGMTQPSSHLPVGPPNTRLKGWPPPLCPHPAFNLPASPRPTGWVHLAPRPTGRIVPGTLQGAHPWPCCSPGKPPNASSRPTWPPRPH